MSMKEPTEDEPLWFSTLPYLCLILLALVFYLYLAIPSKPLRGPDSGWAGMLRAPFVFLVVPTYCLLSILIFLSSLLPSIRVWLMRVPSVYGSRSSPLNLFFLGGMFLVVMHGVILTPLFPFALLFFE